jgi:5-methylcytosine-specific restriction enzyme A
MPRHRPQCARWQRLRKKVWQRDNGMCVRCQTPLELHDCHIDHIVSGKSGNNQLSNLRVLCYRCHALRADPRHRGMTASALRKGIIPSNWRELLWEEGE